MSRALALLACCAVAASAVAPAPVRTIIHIVADDIGANDLLTGTTATPRVSALAASGWTLERFYTAPSCAPSRASVMTGRLPFHFGYYVKCVLLLPLPSSLLLLISPPTASPSDEGGIPAQYELLPAALKKAGFATHMLGKWHGGFKYKTMTPTYRGFDSFFGFYHWGEEYYDHVFPPYYKGKQKCRGVDLSNSTGASGMTTPPSLLCTP